mmetsp:Transcript_9360/g.37930  ORF Transcript_9360/g.37930 Transcript_9360/m.37930 type:complete len:1127 (-) Transcript_9360:375-3755(-)
MDAFTGPMGSSDPPPTPPKAPPRYRPGPWKHNSRVALALIPSIVVVVSDGGRLMMGTLVVGLMVVYILDVLKMAEAALISLWCTLVAVYLAMLIATDLFTPARSPLASIALLLSNCLCLFLAGLWATLQFRWVQTGFPAVALACERALFATIPPACGAICAWTAVASVGASHAPYYAAVAFAWLYKTFSFPTPSSFRGPSLKPKPAVGADAVDNTGGIHGDALVLGAGEAAAHCAMVCLAPACAYAAAHSPAMDPGHIFSSGGGSHNIGAVANAFEHACSVALLLSFPVLFLCVYADDGALWWALGNAVDSSRAFKTTRAVVAAVALVLFTGGLEGCVLFRGFGEYVRLPGLPGVVAVTAAVYGGLLAAVAALSGSVGSKNGVPSEIYQAALVTAGCAAALATGAPPWMLPFAAIGSIGASRFYLRGAAVDLAMFAGGVAACGAWFLHSNFWSLDVDVDGLPLAELCRLLFLSLCASALAPGLARFDVHPSSLGLLVCLHAMVFARCEDALHSEALEDGEPMYPAYLVLATSALGVVLAGSLERTGKVTTATAWMARCVYVGKLALVMLPGSRALVPCVLVGMAATAPFALDSPTSRTTRAGGRRARMSVARGLAHVVSLGLAMVHARFAVFDVVFAVTGHRPSDATLFGGLLLFAGAGSTPLVRRHFSHLPAFRRGLACVVTAGTALVSLRPPMPWKGEIGFWYDADHVPDAEPDDVDIYGDRGDATGRGYSAWLLIATVLLGVFVASAPKPPRRGATGTHATPAPLRAMLSAAAGASLGLYLSVEYFPGFRGDSVVTVSLCAACALCAVFLAFTYVPSTSSPAVMPHVFATYLVCLGVAFWTQRDMYGEFDGPGAGSPGREARIGLVGVTAGLTAQMAFALKLKVAAVSANPGANRTRTAGGARGHVGTMKGARSSRFQPFSGRSPARFKSAGGALAQRALRAMRVGWMPVVGNISTFVTFASATVLATWSRPDSCFAAFAVAPFLLLLHEDELLFDSLSGTQRYVPPMASIVISLAYNAVADALDGPPTAHAALAVGGDLAWTVKNVACVAAAAPNAWFLAEYLWSHRPTSGLAMATAAPLNVLVATVGDVFSARVLACVSLVSAIAQWGTQRAVRVAGLKAL